MDMSDGLVPQQHYCSCSLTRLNKEEEECVILIQSVQLTPTTTTLSDLQLFSGHSLGHL